MTEWFSIHNIVFEIFNYKVSYVELLGTLFGVISVYFASRANILTWPTGIFNELFFFILFYQIGLYPDMFLQCYFFIVTLYGWYNWRRPDTKQKIGTCSRKVIFYLLITIITGTIISGSIFSKVHIYLPSIFQQPASFPFVDSFIMVGSIIGTALLAMKKIENWIFWIIIDIVATLLYCVKGVYLLSIEYLLFTCLASFGLYNWHKQLPR